MRAAAAALTLMVGLTALMGCAASGGAPRSSHPPAKGPTKPVASSPVDSPQPDPLPSGPPPKVHALDGCITGRSATIVSTPEPGGWLPVAFLGRGRSVVILSEQSDELACDWLPLARRLVRQGYRVALYDFTGEEEPPQILKRVEDLAARRGARRIALLGSSEGAKASLMAAAASGRPRPSAVIALSAEQSLGGVDVAPSVRHLHVPMLLVSARKDPYGSAIADRRFMRVAPVADKHIVWVPGYEHGTDLLRGSHRRVVLAAVTRFLTAHLG